jgi:hypothetical protein
MLEKQWTFQDKSSHCYDLSPAMVALMPEVHRELPWPGEPRVEYRPLQYVQDQCASLALQLSADA